MEFKDLKIGMKVRITTDEDELYGTSEREWKGKPVTICKIVDCCEIYVKENDIAWGAFQLMPTSLGGIFVIKTETVNDTLEIFNIFGAPFTGDEKEIAKDLLSYYEKEKETDSRTLGIAIKNGKSVGWCNLEYYKRHKSEFGNIYTLDEIKIYEIIPTKMEEKKMKVKTKANTNNIPKKKEFKDFTVKTETIERWIKGQKKSITKTTVSTPYGTASAEKETAFADERKGCLYACAKIAAQKNDTSRMLYELGNERVELSIYHEILANHAVRNGNFNATYEKYEAIEKYNYAIDCRCTICGKQFDSPEQAREHERWHSLNRKAKHDRYLIRREAREKIAKAAHDEAVAAEIKKLMEAE